MQEIAVRRSWKICYRPSNRSLMSRLIDQFLEKCGRTDRTWTASEQDMAPSPLWNA
jgi:hypothetical protein